MSKWAGTLIGGGIGWALGGPLGAVFGALLGSMFGRDTAGGTHETQFNPFTSSNFQTRPGDFAVALLSLFAYVSKADRQLLSSEIRYVKKFLIEKFGPANAQDLLYLYKEILRKDFDIREISAQVRSAMDYYARLELLHILFGIARADGQIHPAEVAAIQKIASGLGIQSVDFDSIRAIFIGDARQAYRILNVSPTDNDEIIKKAYRDLAVKYHPDKVTNLGPEIQKMAEEKFKAINEAYQTIRKEKGF
jgi:DnaJ like chaperone protein